MFYLSVDNHIRGYKRDEKTNSIISEIYDRGGKKKFVDYLVLKGGGMGCVLKLVTCQICT